MPTKRRTLPRLRVADLSIGHLTLPDRQLIGDPATPGVSLTGEYGALIYLPSDRADLAQRREAGYSDAFLRIMRRATRESFTHVRFDCDGPRLPDLPFFK